MTRFARWLPAWVRHAALGLAVGLATPALAAGDPAPSRWEQTSELPAGPSAGAATARGVAVPPTWQTLDGEHLRIHGPERHLGLMRALLEHADPRVPVLAERLGAPPGSRIDVFLSSTDEEFRRVQPGDPPRWADATAYPALGAVFLRAPGARRGDPEPLDRVLDHELVHVVVGRIFAPRRAPTWLQEGLAQLHAGQHDASTGRELARAALTGAIPLRELERSFPENPHAATLAYAQSVDFLAWLERTYGDDAVPGLVAALRSGATLPDAIFVVTGKPLAEVDAAWSGRFSYAPQALLTLVGSPDFMWFVSAVVGVAAMFVVRRRQRRRRAVIRTRERRDAELLQAFIDRFSRMDGHRGALPYRDVGP
jgi:hypothetical protein